MTKKPSEYDAVVPADKMPPCPICGRSITENDRIMVFIAHGLVALGHEAHQIILPEKVDGA